MQPPAARQVQSQEESFFQRWCPSGETFRKGAIVVVAAAVAALAVGILMTSYPHLLPASLILQLGHISVLLSEALGVALPAWAVASGVAFTAVCVLGIAMLALTYRPNLVGKAPPDTAACHCPSLFSNPDALPSSTEPQSVALCRAAFPPDAHAYYYAFPNPNAAHNPLARAAEVLTSTAGSHERHARIWRVVGAAIIAVAVALVCAPSVAVAFFAAEYLTLSISLSIGLLPIVTLLTSNISGRCFQASEQSAYGATHLRAIAPTLINWETDPANIQRDIDLIAPGYLDLAEFRNATTLSPHKKLLLACLLHELQRLRYHALQAYALGDTKAGKPDGVFLRAFPSNTLHEQLAKPLWEAATSAALTPEQRQAAVDASTQLLLGIATVQRQVARTTGGAKIDLRASMLERILHYRHPGLNGAVISPELQIVHRRATNHLLSTGEVTQEELFDDASFLEFFTQPPASKVPTPQLSITSAYAATEIAMERHHLLAADLLARLRGNQSAEEGIPISRLSDNAAAWTALHSPEAAFFRSPGSSLILSQIPGASRTDTSAIYDLTTPIAQAAGSLVAARARAHAWSLAQ